MIRTVVFDDEIKVWWEYLPLADGEEFQIFVNGEQVGATKKSHFNLKKLTPSTRYTISVARAGSGQGAEKIGELSVCTSAAKRNIDITKPPYNAVGDGKTRNTAAIQAALNACKKDERVYIPDGVFLTGALDMPSNTELFLADGAILQGSTDVEEYLPKIKSRFEGWECTCYRSLINTGTLDHTKGCTTENIVIRGGKILGGGEPLRRNTIARERGEVLKAYGLEKELNPPAYYASVLPGRTRGRLICCCNTKNVVIANATVGEAASWNLQFIYCEDVITCGCHICSHHISNGDGWDPDSSENCVLFDATFDTGDDCVAIKSGKNLEGYQIARPSKHIRVFDCEAADGHGIAVGSEMSGGIEDVEIWNCHMTAGTGIYLKSSPKRGGYMKNIRVRNCTMPTLSAVIYKGNDDGEGAPVYPEISDLLFEDVTVSGVGKFTGEHHRVEPETAFVLTGVDEEHPIKNVTVRNLTLQYRQMLPYQMLNFNFVENLQIENIVCKGEV